MTYESLATVVKITPGGWKCFSLVLFIISEIFVERIVRIFIKNKFSLDGHRSVPDPPVLVLKTCQKVSLFDTFSGRVRESRIVSGWIGRYMQSERSRRLIRVERTAETCPGPGSIIPMPPRCSRSVCATQGCSSQPWVPAGTTIFFLLQTYTSDLAPHGFQ